MGVFNFLKKFSKKKEEIEETNLIVLNDCVDSYYKKIIDNTNSKFDDLREKIKIEKKKSIENLNKLEDAELRNKNVPERVKHIIDGNRSTYLQKVNILIEKVDLPKNFDNITDYCESFDKELEFFGKNTLKSYRVLQEFFGDESRSIAENIRDIGKLIKYTKSILDDAKMNNIIELKNRIINIKHKEKRKEEIKKNIGLKKSGLKKRTEKIDGSNSEIKKLESGTKHKRFIKLIERRKILESRIEELKKRLWHSFSVIEPALKKYERITIEKELAGKYLTDSLKTLLDDSELKIIKLLEKMKNLIIDRKIELKDKKMKKVLNELNKLNVDYFDGFLKMYDKINNELIELKSEIEESTIFKDIEKLKGELNYNKNKLKSTKTDIDDMIKELEDIKIKELKKKLEEDVFRCMDKKIIIP